MDKITVEKPGVYTFQELPRPVDRTRLSETTNIRGPFAYYQKTKSDRGRKIFKVTRSEGKVVYMADEFDPYAAIIIGKVQISNILAEIGLNAAAVPADVVVSRLKKFPQIFEDRADYIAVLTSFKRFFAKVLSDSTQDRSRENRGITSKSSSTDVTTDLISNFNIWVRLFPGEPKTIIPVDVELVPNNGSVFIALSCDALPSIIEDAIDDILSPLLAEVVEDGQAIILEA